MLNKSYYNSAFGCFEIKGSWLGIQSVKLVEKQDCLSDENAPKIIKECVQQLEEYFNGQRQKFDIKLDFGSATPFSQSVWREMLKIPYGHTSTYSNIAEKIADIKAVRAVGQASSHNPIAIIVPCHRVIAKDGKLQGYFYGLEMKRQLLELENPLSFSRQGSLF